MIRSVPTENQAGTGRYDHALKPNDPAQKRDYNAALSRLIAEEYLRHRAVLDCPEIFVAARKIFEKICAQEASEFELKTSLILLCKLITSVTKKKPVVLIDEYDNPIHAGIRKQLF